MLNSAVLILLGLTSFKLLAGFSHVFRKVYPIAVSSYGSRAVERSIHVIFPIGFTYSYFNPFSPLPPPLSCHRTLGGNPSIPPLPAENMSLQISSAAVTSSYFYPETWINMDPAQDFVQVPVLKEDKSYRTIYNLFHKTVPETKYRILKILRVQNQFLWEKYKRWVSINLLFEM